MGQLANCQYVCNAINAKWGTSIHPVSGTALWDANIEYTLKVVDLANKKLGRTTSYGTGSYATKQAADVIAVNQCVNTLIKPGKLFVAVAGAGSDKAAYNADGINWTAVTLPSSAAWTSLTYGNGRFVALVGNSNKAAYSADGINWTAATLPSSAAWTSVCYGEQ